MTSSVRSFLTQVACKMRSEGGGWKKSHRDTKSCYIVPWGLSWCQRDFFFFFKEKLELE